MNEASGKDRAALYDGFIKVWGNPRGWRALTVVNHTAVGIRFMVTGGVFFLIGGLMAMLMRTQLALPEQKIIGPKLYDQLFTMHGTVMMFLFAVPVLEGLALYLIPKMIGARDLLFPRLSAFGYFCYLFGSLILMSSLLLGIAPAGGWFMYTPLTNAFYSPGPNVDFWLLGITFVEISAVSAGVELVVSILRSRTSGMALLHMPLFCWNILVMALMIVFGFPPLIMGSILLELERAAGMPFFDVARGGDPILWQHLFWLFGHPEVYIIFLPAAGIVSTLLPVFARRPIVGYRWIVLAVDYDRFHQFRPVGASYVCDRDPEAGAGILLDGQHAGRDSDRYPAIRLAGDAVDRAAGLSCADALADRFSGHLRDRRIDRHHAGPCALQLAGARHAFCRRSFALCRRRRHAVSIHRGTVLLAAAFLGTHALR